MKNALKTVIVLALLAASLDKALDVLAAEPMDMDAKRLANIERQIQANEFQEKHFEAYGALKIRGLL